MSGIWRDKIISWKKTASWVPVLSKWIRPFLNERGIRSLRQMGEQDICSDDWAWLDITQKILSWEIEGVIQSLADAIVSAKLVTYHACRTEDAGIYHRNGIRLNNPSALADEARRLVAEEDDLAFMRPTIENDIKCFDAFERDTGKLYVVVDDRPLIEVSGHYLLYGSEWVQGLLGWSAHRVLRNRGAPTMLIVELPLAEATFHELEQLARVLLQEWTRVKVNAPDWVHELDFSFCVRRDVPPDWVIGHFHPAVICDPFYQNIKRRNDFTDCPHCKR